MKLQWHREAVSLGTDYVSGPYRIERFEGLAGARYVWVLTGPAGERKCLKLRDAKREAERHSNGAPTQTETPAAESTDAR